MRAYCPMLSKLLTFARDAIVDGYSFFDQGPRSVCPRALVDRRNKIKPRDYQLNAGF